MLVVFAIVCVICVSCSNACIDERGKNRVHGEQWMEPQGAFIMNCTVIPGLAWKTDVVACLTPNQTRIALGHSLVQAGTHYTCEMVGPKKAVLRTRTFHVTISDGTSRRNFTVGLPANLLGQPPDYRNSCVLTSDGEPNNGIRLVPNGTEWGDLRHSVYMKCFTQGMGLFQIKPVACITPAGVRIEPEESVIEAQQRIRCYRMGRFLYRSTSPIISPRGPGKPPAYMGCSVGSRFFKHNEEWIENGTFVWRCSVGHGNWKAEVVACLTPGNKRILLGQSKVELLKRYSCRIKMFEPHLDTSSVNFLPIKTATDSTKSTTKTTTSSFSSQVGTVQSVTTTESTLVESTTTFRTSSITTAKPLPRLTTTTPTSTIAQESTSGHMTKTTATTPSTTSVNLFSCSVSGSILRIGQEKKTLQYLYRCSINPFTGKARAVTVACFTNQGTQLRVGHAIEENGYAYNCRRKPDGKIDLYSDIAVMSATESATFMEINPTPIATTPKSISKDCYIQGRWVAHKQEVKGRNYVLQCVSLGKGFRSDVVACITPKGTTVYVDDTLIEDGVEYRCRPVGQTRAYLQKKPVQTESKLFLDNSQQTVSRHRNSFQTKPEASVGCWSNGIRYRVGEQYDEVSDGTTMGWIKRCFIQGSHAAGVIIGCIIAEGKRVLITESLVPDQQIQECIASLGTDNQNERTLKQLSTTEMRSSAAHEGAVFDTEKATGAAGLSVIRINKEDCQNSCRFKGNEICPGQEWSQSFLHGLFRVHCISRGHTKILCSVYDPISRKSYELHAEEFTVVSGHILACANFEDTPKSFFEPHIFSLGQRQILEEHNYKFRSAVLQVAGL